MTMFARMWTAGLLAVAGVLVGTSANQAAEVFRLALPANTEAPTLNLVQAEADDGDTMDVRFYHGGGFRGGYVVRGGHYGGYAHGYHGGYARGYYGGYARGYYGGSYGYRSVYRYAYYPPVYNYYYCPPQYYTPIATSPSVATTTFSLRVVPLSPQAVPQPLPLSLGQPTLPAPNQNPGLSPNPGTFEYDGGPRAPVPLPRAEPTPMNPQPSLPLDGRPVSLPLRATPKYTYPAYGELPRTPAPKDGSIPVRADANRRVQP
jgi:hypothetical protein